MSKQSRERERQREREAGAAGAKPKEQVTAFPAKPGEFADVAEDKLTPEQREYLDTIRKQFPGAMAATRPGSGILHVITADRAIAFQTLPKFRQLG